MRSDTSRFIQAALSAAAVSIAAGVASELRARRTEPEPRELHSFLELMPLAAVMLVSLLHWPQFKALLWLETAPRSTTIRLKREPLETAYIVAVLEAMAAAGGPPYCEELCRDLRGRRDDIRPGRRISPR